MSLLHSTILIGKPAEFIRLSLLRSIEMLQAEFPIPTVPPPSPVSDVPIFVKVCNSDILFSNSSCEKNERKV